MTPSTKLE